MNLIICLACYHNVIYFFSAIPQCNVTSTFRRKVHVPPIDSVSHVSARKFREKNRVHL